MISQSHHISSDVEDYRGASGLSDVSLTRADAIETMIRLSLTSTSKVIRQSASDWLAEHCNVKVSQEIGGFRATSAPANDIC